MGATYIYDNDGHFGAFISFIILRKYVGDDLIGVSLTQGDSLTDVAALTYERLFHMFGGDNYLAVGNKEVLNPFPQEWREMSREFDAIIAKNCKGSIKTTPLSFEQFVVRAVEKVTVIATGPLTNVAELLRTNDPVFSKIDRVVIMGGAVNVGGNVKQSMISDGTAEWNFFADPIAAKKVLSSGLPITLVPLDVTNAIPIDPKFIDQVAGIKSKTAELVLPLLRYAYSKYPGDYYLWEPIAVLAAIEPSTVQIARRSLDVITTGRSQGRVVASDTGHPCDVVVRIDKEKMLGLFFEALDQL